MSTNIKTLLEGNGIDEILPRTVAEAVTIGNKTVKYKIENDIVQTENSVLDTPLPVVSGRHKREVNEYEI